jgi:hypothetical protein
VISIGITQFRSSILVPEVDRGVVAVSDKTPIRVRRSAGSVALASLARIGKAAVWAAYLGAANVAFFATGSVKAGGELLREYVQAQAEQPVPDPSTAEGPEATASQIRELMDFYVAGTCAAVEEFTGGRVGPCDELLSESVAFQGLNAIALMAGVQVQKRVARSRRGQKLEGMTEGPTPPLGFEAVAGSSAGPLAYVVSNQSGMPLAVTFRPAGSTAPPKSVRLSRYGHYQVSSAALVDGMEVEVSPQGNTALTVSMAVDRSGAVRSWTANGDPMPVPSAAVVRPFGADPIGVSPISL